MVVFFVGAEDTLAKQRLADLLKDLRGYETQRQFAKRLGTSYTSIQDWEKQIRLPSEKNLKRIAQLKGWTYEKLVLFLFNSDVQSTTVTTDPLELIMACVQKLTLPQKQKLRDYLTAQIPQHCEICETIRNYNLSLLQKHNLHLLLRASLKHKDPLEAIEQTGIEPDLFADVFVRDDENRQISYSELEKLSSLCCRVIRWRDSQLPEVDLNRTYADQTELLLNDLSENTSSQ